VQLSALRIPAFMAAITASVAAEVAITPDDPSSLQRALDASPGRVLYVPPGDYHLTRALQLRRDHSGLWGTGRIIQDDPAQDIVNIEGAVTCSCATSR